MTPRVHHINTSPFSATIVHLPRLVISAERRPVSIAKAQSIAESIRTLGLLQRPAVWIDDNGAAHLVWGAHRVEALRLINPDQSVEMIDVTRLSAQERILAEIDENLKRADLTREQRTTETARRIETAERIEAERKTAEKTRKAEVAAERALARKRAERARKAVTVSGDTVTQNRDKGGRPKGTTQSERREVVEAVAKAEGVTPGAVNRRLARTKEKTNPKPLARYGADKWRREMDKLIARAPDADTEARFRRALAQSRSSSL